MFTSEEKMELMRYDDGSKEAMAYRLKIARIAAGREPIELAREVGLSIATYAHQEKGRVFPSRDVMKTLYRSYGIDFNFMHLGQFNHLSPDLQSKLFSAAASVASQSGQAQG